MITIECQRIGCGEMASTDDDLYWWGDVVSNRIEVTMPEGWAIDRVGDDQVIHCPKHAS